MTDGGWITLLAEGHSDPLQAVATAVDPYLTVGAANRGDDATEFVISRGEQAHKESGEVAITRFSSGSSFEFTDRGRSIPIMPVGSAG